MERLRKAIDKKAAELANQFYDSHSARIYHLYQCTWSDEKIAEKYKDEFGINTTMLAVATVKNIRERAEKEAEGLCALV
jgi:hypothetical protein